MRHALYATRRSKVESTKFSAPLKESSVSDSAAFELASFRELEHLVRSLGDELAGFRRRALTAENRLKALEAASAPGDLFSHERLAAAEQENADLKRRLAAATERTNQVVAQLRFLRQQHERAGSDR